MKRNVFLNLTIVLILSTAILSCDKEEVIDSKSYIVLNWLRNYDSCNSSFAFCFSREGITKKLAEQLIVNKDQAITAPLYQSNGHIIMEMEMLYDDLSDQARLVLFEEDYLIVEESFVLDEITMEQAYSNANKAYSGERLEVISGLYPIKKTGTDSPALKKIKIKITFMPGEITITITW